MSSFWVQSNLPVEDMFDTFLMVDSFLEPAKYWSNSQKEATMQRTLLIVVTVLEPRTIICLENQFFVANTPQQNPPSMKIKNSNYYIDICLLMNFFFTFSLISASFDYSFFQSLSKPLVRVENAKSISLPSQNLSNIVFMLKYKIIVLLLTQNKFGILIKRTPDYSLSG